MLTPQEIALIYDEVPAVCAIKEGLMEHWRSRSIHALAPRLVVWECDTIVYRAGWLQEGVVGPAQLGTAGYLRETPEKPYLTEYWRRIWYGRIAEAIEYAKHVGLDELQAVVGRWYTRYPGRHEYFTHWGEAFRYAASVLGLPMGDYPHSRPPQGILPDAAKAEMRAAFEKVGLARQPVSA